MGAAYEGGSILRQRGRGKWILYLTASEELVLGGRLVKMGNHV